MCQIIRNQVISISLGHDNILLVIKIPFLAHFEVLEIELILEHSERSFSLDFEHGLSKKIIS